MKFGLPRSGNWKVMKFENFAYVLFHLILSYIILRDN